MKSFRTLIRIFNHLLISKFLSWAQPAAVHLKQGLKRAFLFTATLSLLLVGQSTFLLSQAHADTDPTGYAQSIAANGEQLDFFANECTSFVAWMLNHTSLTYHGMHFTNKWGPTPSGPNHWGVAKEWDEYAKAIGFTVDDTPAIGAVAQWNANMGGAGDSGHVARVTYAYPDGYADIQEYNWGANAHAYGTRTHVKPENYIHLERSLPGGYWSGNTPSNGILFSGATFSTHLQDNNNGGLDRVDYTVSESADGSTWNAWHSIYTRSFFGSFTGDASTIYSIPAQYSCARVSYNVFSNNRSKDGSQSRQLSPMGMKLYHAQSVADSYCNPPPPDQQFNGFDLPNQGGGSSGGGSTQTGCVPGQYQAAVFVDSGYGGSCVIKGIGEYLTPESIGLPNDSISSIKVGSGANVRLCENSGLTSPCFYYSADDDRLGYFDSIGDNTVSSIKVEGGGPTTNCVPGEREVAFFMNENYQETCIIRGVGRYNDAAALGLPDNTISSVKVGARAWVRICDNVNNNSPCDQFENDRADLTATTVQNNTASSAEVFLKGGIALCDNDLTDNNGGECKYFGAGDTGENLQNMSSYNFDNRIQSVRYDPDWEGRYHIVLYVDQNQTGALAHYDGTVAALQDPYRNSISSIKIYKNQPPNATVASPANGTIFPATTTSVNLAYGGGPEKRVHVWNATYDFWSDWMTPDSYSLTGLTPGTYNWQVQARSSILGEGPWSAISSFSINTPPTVVGGDLTMDAGVAQTIQIQAFDAEQSPVTLAASGLPSFATFTDNGGGVGSLALNPDTSVSGQFTITVTANDGDITSTGTIVVTVNAVQPAGYQADYFNNMTLSGTPILSRVEQVIDNDWGGGGPGSGVNTDDFSARWTKTTAFSAGTYRFSVTADDGVRLYIDNVLSIDKWIDQGATTYTVDKTLAAGDHTIKVEYYENGGGAVAKFSYQQTTPPPAGTQVTSQVTASSDDGEENASTTMSLASSDLELTCDTVTTPCPSNDPGKQTIGMRFAGLNIPKGATITSANIVFTAKEAQSEATSVTFNGQATDNATTFTTTSGNISSRAKTTASVGWSSLPAWTVGTTYQTPDLSPIVQEIVNRSGWTSGNAAAIIVTGLGHRTPWSFDGSSSAAPKLVVYYTPDSTTPPSAPIANGLYKLVNVGSNKTLDVNGAGTTDGTNVQIWTDNGGSSQQWQVTQNADGTYKLVNPNSNKALDVNGAGTTDGTNVQIWTDNAGAAQKWQVVQNADGSYKLVNPNSGKVLDVSGGGSADGTNVQIWTDNGSAAQKWQITAVGTATPPPAYSVTSLTLINADTDQPIATFDPLADGATLNLATLPTRNLSIRANTAGTIGSVKFNYDGNANYHTENTAPYGISGDNAGDYNTGWTPSIGQHTLTVTPYSGADGSGTAGGSLARTFSVVDTPPPAATPTFTGSGTVSGSSFVAGNTLTMNASFTSTSASNSTTRIHFEVRSPSDQQVFAKDFDNESFAPGQTKNYTATWTIPQGAATGSYVVKGGAVSADWGTWYLWVNNMGQFTVSAPATSTELLTAAWNLTGNNGASEKYQSIASNALAGKTTVRVTYNLHGLSALGGDASAIIFDQNGWHYVSLSNYGQNGLNGSQTVDIPLSAFGLDLTQPVGTLHTRFWYGSAFTVDITSVQVL